MFDRKVYMKEYNKRYHIKNKKRLLLKAKKYRKENCEILTDKSKERYKKYGKEYRLKNIERARKSAKEWARKDRKEHPEKYKTVWNNKIKEYQRSYREENKEEIAKKRNKRIKERLKNDIQFKLKWLFRGRISSAIKKNCASKAYKTIELLGCSIEQAKNHIEKQFTEGMSWDNHGEWEIDHIKPIALFDLTIPKEQKMAFHYTNIQPLIKDKNRSKGSKWDDNIV